MIDEEITEWSTAEQRAADKHADAWHDLFGDGGDEQTERLDEFVETAAAAEAKAAHEEELFARENVIGVATSLKVTKGKPTSKPSVTVFVEEKKPKTQLSKEALVPAEVDGIPTDVVEVGQVRPLTFTARIRPAFPGYSIGHHNITAGTFGCLVRDIRRCCCELEKGHCCTLEREECRGDYLILSNNHVLAASNFGKPGDLVLQPGPFDGGVFPGDEIATLERFEPIVFGASGYNLVDAAIARPTFSRNVTPAIIGLVIPQGVGQARVGQRVVKAGRTTQVRTGRVIAIDALIAVGPYAGGGVAQFRNQILTTVIGGPGDSGSLLMDANLNAVGLLFAGSSKVTIHNHIANVETALGVRPVTAPRFA
jgi:hypothetical protein